MVKKVEGGILAAKGYRVASKRVGIKPTGDIRDRNRKRKHGKKKRSGL